MYVVCKLCRTGLLGQDIGRLLGVCGTIIIEASVLGGFGTRYEYIPVPYTRSLMTHIPYLRDRYPSRIYFIRGFTVTLDRTVS